MPPDPNATVDESTPVNVSVLDTVRAFEFAIVSVAEVAGSVIITLFIDVADATPMLGVTKLGLFEKTRDPVPVSSDIIPNNSDDVVEAN